MSVPVTHLIVGPREHGVARFGIGLVEALRDNGFGTATQYAADIGSVRMPTDSRGVHLQFTDRLFGDTPERAAAAVRTVAETVRARGGRVTATLHDLPQPSDGTPYPRRRTAYGAVADLIDGVVVSSDHERALMTEAGLHPRRTAVVPLPMDAVCDDPPQLGTDAPTVGIFGFVYPGKGHAEVIAALEAAPADVEVLVLGAPSAGHEDLIGALAGDCARVGRPFRVTGHITDADLRAALRGVTVPVAPHRHVSASGSLNSWISAGRRPLAPANRYTREIDARSPGTISLYADTPAGLRDALARALDDPATTWLPPGTTCAPTRDEAARQYADLLGRWHR